MYSAKDVFWCKNKLKSILGMSHCASGCKSRPPVDIVEGWDNLLGGAQWHIRWLMYIVMPEVNIFSV